MLHLNYIDNESLKHHSGRQQHMDRVQPKQVMQTGGARNGAMSKLVSAVPFQSMKLLRRQGFWFSSICSSPSLLIVNWQAGYRTPVLLLLSWSFN